MSVSVTVAASAKQWAEPEPALLAVMGHTALSYYITP